MSETFESGTTSASASGTRDDDFTRSDDSRSNGSTKERIRGFANKQKDAGLDQMSGFASAAHKAADAIGEKIAGIAGLVHEAADSLDRMSESLREQDVSQIYNSVQDFAKRQPLVFLAGSFAAGVMLARFLKSSSDAASQSAPATPQPYHPSPSL